MSPELSKELTRDYPKIFDPTNEFAKDPDYYYGFECGDGWYWLIDHLCEHLQWHIDQNGLPQVTASQVKEKFGGLRFYYGGRVMTKEVADEIRHLVDEAEEKFLAR